MTQVRDAIDATVASVASKATGTGSAVTVVGWLTSSNFGMWAGIAIGVGGLIVNWYYRRKADRREAEAHEMHIYKMRKRTRSPDSFEADE